MTLFTVRRPQQICAIILTCWVLHCPAQAQSATTGASQPVSSQVAIEQFVGRYPANRIDSVVMADRALAEAADARAVLAAKYAAEEGACYSKFFTNACIDSAKERQRLGLAAIRPIELEASAFKRKARVQERDQELAEKQNKAQAKEQAEAPERLRLQQENQQRLTQRADQAARETAQQQAKQASHDGRGPDPRVQQHAEKLRRQQAEDAASQPEREKNIAAYQEKVRQAGERQKKLAEKRAKKAAERAKAPDPAGQ